MAFFSSHDNIAVPQLGQLLRNRTLLNLELRTQIINANLATAQGINNPYPERVSKGLKKLGLKLGQISHCIIYILIYLDIIINKQRLGQAREPIPVGVYS